MTGLVRRAERALIQIEGALRRNYTDRAPMTSAKNSVTLVTQKARLDIMTQDNCPYEGCRTKLTFGLWLKDRRIGAGRSAAELAHLTGVSAQTWASWESDSAPLPATYVCAAADALHINLRAFLNLMDRFSRLKQLGELLYTAGVSGLPSHEEALLVLGSFEESYEAAQQDNDPGYLTTELSHSGVMPLAGLPLPPKHPDRLKVLFTRSGYERLTGRIWAWRGNIAMKQVDAIVNASDTSLSSGDGVGRAIHEAAGSGLAWECSALEGCTVGQAKITGGHDLYAKWVIHTVGPVWRNGREGEDELLADCYRNSLALAEEYGVKTIAFPAISTGFYRFPVERATGIAVVEARKWLGAHHLPEQVAFVCLSDDVFQSYATALADDAHQA